MYKYIDYDSCVVHDRVESTHYPGYYEIPFFSKYLVSENGTVKEKAYGKNHHNSKSATSKGSYLTVTINSDLCGRITVGTHILTALAFHGVPEDDSYEVNHGDGNKHNNFYTNLEWMTRSENLNHAYETGLRGENRMVIAYDVKECRSIKFPSISALEKLFGLIKGAGKRLIRNHSKTPYEGKWVFRYDETREVKPNNFPWVRVVYSKNHITGEIIVSSDMSTAEINTGVPSATIYYNLINELEKPILGWTFKFQGDKKPWKEISKLRAEASVELPKARNPIIIHDSRDNTTRFAASLAAFAISIDEHPNTLRRAMSKYKVPLKFKDYTVSYVI